MSRGSQLGVIITHLESIYMILVCGRSEGMEGLTVMVTLQLWGWVLVSVSSCCAGIAATTCTITLRKQVILPV